MPAPEEDLQVHDVVEIDERIARRINLGQTVYRIEQAIFGWFKVGFLPVHDLVIENLSAHRSLIFNTLLVFEVPRFPNDNQKSFGALNQGSFP